MFRTLSQLRDSVDRLIEQQGENALCAAFVFTKEDICGDEVIDDEYVEVTHEDLEEAYPGIITTVLEEVGGSSYVYDEVNEMIDDEMNRFRNKQTK
jgi:hypothetical protein